MAAIFNHLIPQKKKEKLHVQRPFVHKPLILSGKQMVGKHFELMQDFLSILPHAKKEDRVSDDEFYFLDETAFDNHCDTVILFETRARKTEPYLWIARCPDGPSITMFIEEEESIQALQLLGNCLKGSRPILLFDPSFDSDDSPNSLAFKIAKELFIRAFSVPFQDPRSKPFVDHTLSFFRNDNYIEIRHYQIHWDDESLLEIGPRVTFRPISIFQGAFKGHKIWKDKTFISPNKLRKEEKKKKSEARNRERDHQAVREERKSKIEKPKNPMKGLFKPPK